MIRIYGISRDQLLELPDLRERIGAQWIDAWNKKHPSLEGDAARLSLGGLFLLQEAVGKGCLTYTPMGRPFFADSMQDFSITHTRDAVFCAVAPRGSSWHVGLDAEDLGRLPKERLESLSHRWFREEEQRIFEASPNEKTFLSIWTRKEALVKRTGEGLRQMAALDTYALCEAQKAAFWTYWQGDVCVTLCANEGAMATERILFYGAEE